MDAPLMWRACWQEFPPQREVSEQGELVRGLGIRLHLQRQVDAGADGVCGAQAVIALDDSALFSQRCRPGRLARPGRPGPGHDCLRLGSSSYLDKPCE